MTVYIVGPPTAIDRWSQFEFFMGALGAVHIYIYIYIYAFLGLVPLPDSFRCVGTIFFFRILLVSYN